MTFHEAPASIGQRLLWFLEHYRPDTASLNCPVVCKLHGPLDVDELKIALRRLTDRHEALRTTLVRDGRKLVQRIHRDGEPPLREENLAAADGSAPETAFERALEAELQVPVDVGTWPLRCTLWRLGPDEHALCLTMHHLVSDAWSCGIILQDLIKLLDAGPETVPELPPVAFPYSAFARRQHEQAKNGELKAHQDYWVGKLRDMRLVRLPETGRQAPGEGRASGIETAVLPPEVFGKLREVARAERTTLFTVMLSLYYLLLARTTGQTDLPVASLFANRSGREVQSTVGFFANMVVLRSQVDPDAPFSEVVRSVRPTVIDGFLHESIPYQMLPLSFQDNGGRVDDVVFQMLLTPPPGTKVHARGVDFELYTPDVLGSRFGLELGLIPQHTGDCQAMLFYTTDRISPQWAKDFLADYAAMAAAAAADPSAVVAAAAATAR
ncbi:condensation domain-containing protein [Amycolatopsis sp. NPDC059090]|uniref:condensation domain-containing protein n=1 Tax=unclassified Amycolatopsis TaxID=2618356 RepID=UPI00366D0F19